MKFENSKVMNFDGAFRGLRNPLESWSKSDSSYFVCGDFPPSGDKTIEAWVRKTAPDIEEGSADWENLFNHYYDWLISQGILTPGSDDYSGEYFWLGPNDLNLAQRMIKAGSSDRKFMRQIMVSVDITAPLYWQVFSFCQ